MSVVTASNNYVNTLNIQLPFACNAQIIKDFLPITTDKEGKVLKFLIFQLVKKTLPFTWSCHCRNLVIKI